MSRNNRIKTHEEVLKAIEDLRELQKTDPVAARIVARVALIKTGVLNEDGSSKEKIVDYPHSLTYEHNDGRKGPVRKRK